MQELVGAMGVGIGSQDAAHHELRGRKAFTQQVHQRNRAALADVAARGIEILAGCSIQRGAEPGRGFRRVPAAGHPRIRLEQHARLVGRILLQQLFQVFCSGPGIDQRRQAQGQLESRARPQHVAGTRHRRQAFGARDGQRRPPGAIQHGLLRIPDHRQDDTALGTTTPGKALPDLISQDAGGGLSLFGAFGRNVAMEAVGQHTARPAVFQPVQQMAQDAEAGWHDTAGIAGMHAFVQHLDFERTGHQPPQRGRHPELIIVAGPRVQAHHQGDAPQPVTQGIHIRQQIVAARFFAGFDQADTARTRDALAVECFDGRDRSIDGITVIRPTPAIELAVAHHRGPRPEPGPPAGKFGLFVQVAVHQHGAAVILTRGGGLEKQHRRTARQADDFDGEPLDAPGPDPLGSVFHHPSDMAVRVPVGVEGGTFCRHGNVVGQRRNDFAVPGIIDESPQGNGIQPEGGGNRRQRIHGISWQFDHPLILRRLPGAFSRRPRPPPPATISAP